MDGRTEWCMAHTVVFGYMDRRTDERKSVVKGTHFRAAANNGEELGGGWVGCGGCGLGGCRRNMAHQMIRANKLSCSLFFYSMNFGH